MRPREVDYANYNKHYMDVATGEVLVGDAEGEVYRSERVEPLQLRDVGHLLRAERGQVPDFSEEREDTSQWPPEKFIQYGQWVRAIVAPPGKQEKHLNERIFNNARKMGLGPDRKGISPVYGSMSALYVEMGEGTTHIVKQYEELGLADLVALVRRIGGRRRPSRSEFDKLHKLDPSIPSATVINEKTQPIGGYNKLLELAGYPVIDLWSLDDYIDWGVQFAEANDGILPSARMADYFATRRLGPSGRSIANKFGKVSIYQALVRQRYGEVLQERRRAQAAKLVSLTEDLEKGSVPMELYLPDGTEEKDADRREQLALANFQKLEPDEKIARYAKYKVLEETIPSMGTDTRTDLASKRQDRSFLAAARKHHEVPAGDIEYGALVLGFFDDIWPMNAHLKTLKLNKGYSRYYQRREKPKKASPPARRLPSNVY